MTSHLHRAASLALLAGLCGCMGLRPGRASPVSGYVLYQDSTGPLAYRAPTPADARGADRVTTVQGRACQSGIVVPFGWLFALGENGNDQVGALASASVAWGLGGYAQALADAQTKAPGRRLYDVRADLQVLSVLTVWRQACVLVTAEAAGY